MTLGEGEKGRWDVNRGKGVYMYMHGHAIILNK